ncbi:hypothetical protein [uncultured Clostridium sp.]|uniref:hypothetical protein n=1 Tax=uncultured Clostridium sp. TaxID=59620 RepID=UPI0025F0AFAE|nr:hypothetical protein [uncultured Clostridium sp.]
MSKKIISIFMSLVVAASLVGCGGSTTGNSSSEKTAKSTDSAGIIESTELSAEQQEGTWAKNYTLDETKKLYEDKLSTIKEITDGLGVKYTNDEVIKKEDNVTITDNSIYFDNENPENNKIESMYYGLKIYGENLEEGVISLKLTLKFDGKEAVNNKDFDLGKTSFVKYIEAFTGEADRDYSDINNEILERLSNGETEVRINNTIDGLNEEILASNDCIFYKLSTKKYKFADAEMSME